MNILVACEESQRVCTEFRKKGHEAYSCDIIECSGGHPEWHIKDDVLKHLDGWDMIIAFPPCTYLTVTANRWYNIERYGDKAIERLKEREKAIAFFMKLVNAECPRIAIENPIGIMSTIYRRPDQIIEPYYFGENARKKTCLWLKNLSCLKPTEIVDPGEISKYGQSVNAYAQGKDFKTGKWFKYTDPELKKLRSKTFPGIAKAMADQWG